MALITYTNKDESQPEGDPRKHFIDDNANEIKAVVNTNRADSDSSAFNFNKQSIHTYRQHKQSTFSNKSSSWTIKC